MSWKDTLKAYNPDEMDAKRKKIQQKNEYLRRQKKRDEQIVIDLKSRISQRDADANLIRDLQTDKKTTKRRKKPRKGSPPPPPQRGGKR